jgi:hypothetical protein
MKYSLRFWSLALAGLWLTTPLVFSQSPCCATSAWGYDEDSLQLVRFDLGTGSETFSFTAPPSGNSVESLVVAGAGNLLIYLTSDVGNTERWRWDGSAVGLYFGPIPPASGRLCPGQVAPYLGFRPGVHKVAFGGPGQACGSPAAFQVRDGKINDGFDPPLSDDPPGELPWASVVKGENSDVAKFVTEPFVAAMTKLVVADFPEYVDVDPKTGLTQAETDVTLSGQLLSLTEPSGFAPFHEAVTEATLEAQDSETGSTFASLNVMALPKRTVSIGIYRVFDPGSSLTSPVGGPSDDEIKTALNKVYKQAGVTFRIDASELRAVEYDRSPDGDHDGRVQNDEMKTIVGKLRDASGKVKVILTKNSGYRYDNDPTKFVRGYQIPVPSFDGSMLFTDTILAAGGDVGLVAAHEMGHVLDITDRLRDETDHDPGPFPAGTGGLMRSGAPAGGVLPANPGLWLPHEDWKKANEEARKYE